MAPARKTLTVVGLGLIGGSIVRAVKARGLPYHVTGVARREATRREALSSGALDEVFATGVEAAPQSDITVLALPVLAIPPALREMAPALKMGSVVTDVGSTKRALTEAVEKFLPRGVSFVGSHPIAGTENSGFSSSFPELFDGARCILTPGKSSTEASLATIRSFWETLGLRVEIMDAATHDHILAVISHLPHLVAYALVNAVSSFDREQPGLLEYTGGGFKDFTRIAASDPVMWRDICLDNRTEVLDTVERFLQEMSHLRDMLRKKDGVKLERAFAIASTARRCLRKAPGTERP